MKTESDVLDLVRRVYARTGGDRAEIARVKPHYGGWLNTLQYDVLRVDGAVATIRRTHVDEGDADALAAELSTFAAPGARTRLCRQCGKWMPECAHFCQACGNRLEHASGPLPIASGNVAAGRAPLRATLAVSAIVCTVGAAAYAWIGRTPAPDAALVQPSLTPDARSATVLERSPPDPTTPAAAGIQPEPIAIQPPQATPAMEPKETGAPDTRTTAATSTAAISPAPESAPKKVAKQSHRHLSSAAAQKRGAIRHDSARTAPHSIDHAFKRISAAKCSAGFAGVLCREKLRFRLCKERWTEHYVPGRSVCHVAAHAERGS